MQGEVKKEKIRNEKKEKNLIHTGIGFEALQVKSACNTFKLEHLI